MLLGSMAFAWPFAARAQHPPTLGFLHSASPERFAPFVAAFHEGLRELGFIDGQNLTIEYRWAEGQSDRLPALAAELVAREVAMIVAAGGTASARAAKAATATLPIVFSIGSDPVASGLVASLSRPGANVTGVSLMNYLLETKRFELIRKLVPNGSSFAVLLNPTSPVVESRTRELQEAARATGQQLSIIHAGSDADLDAAFAALASAEALVVGSSPFFASRRDRIVALAARHRVPAIYEWREFAAAGGLMSYGASLADAYRLVGVYAGRILARVKPADLPVVQPTRFELVINLETAEALGIDIPPSILLRADEVIE